MGDETQKTCDICGQSKTWPKVVVSRGNPRARFMVIGEAPGAKEDLIGQAFVGRSGQLLDKLINHAGFNSHREVYFCNVVKCRPPKNRRPNKTELAQSLPWLYKQIDLSDPWIIALAGSTAVEALLGIKVKMTTIRGKWFNWHGRLLMPIFHPSYLLRNPSPKEGSPSSLTLCDLVEVRNRLSKFEQPDGMRAFLDNEWQML